MLTGAVMNEGGIKSAMVARWSRRKFRRRNGNLLIWTLFALLVPTTTATSASGDDDTASAVTSSPPPPPTFSAATSCFAQSQRGKRLRREVHIAIPASVIRKGISTKDSLVTLPTLDSTREYVLNFHKKQYRRLVQIEAREHGAVVVLNQEQVLKSKVIRAYHAVFAFSISCVNKSGENVVIRRRRGRGLGRDELFVEVDMVGDNVDLCDLQDHLDIAKRVLLYHNYDYTAPENLGRDVLLGQVSPLFHTAKEQCPGGRGIECKILQAAEDDKEEFEVVCRREGAATNGQQMLLARGGLDREAKPSHEGVMVCKVDTGGDRRRYEIRANVTLVVEDADDNAPYPQAEEMTIEVKGKVARKGKLLKGTEWFVEHDLQSTTDDAQSTGRYRISLPKESSLRIVNLTWGARVRMECNGEGSLCPAGIERMDGYLVKMEADFEVTKDVNLPATFDARISDEEKDNHANFKIRLVHAPANGGKESPTISYYRSLTDKNRIVNVNVDPMATANTRVADVYKGHGRGEEIPGDIAGMNIFWTNGSRADLGFTPFSLTRDLSILYVDEEGLMSDGDNFSLIFVAFDHNRSPSAAIPNVTVHVTVVADTFSSNESSTCHAHMDILCADYSIREECVNSCGEGARGGNRCHWVEEDLDDLMKNNNNNNVGNNDHHRQGYSTCSVDASTCPDGRCDQLEQESGLCPQDCIEREGIATPIHSIESEYGLGRDPSHSASNETFCRCHNRGRICYCDTRQISMWNNEHEPAEPLRRDSFCRGENCEIYVAAASFAIAAAILLVGVYVRRWRGNSAVVPCLERPKASPSLTTLPTRSTEYPFLPPRIYNPSTMSTSCAPEMVEMRSIVRLDKEWPHPLIFEKVIGSGEFGEVKSARAYVQRGDEPISAELDLSKLEKDESGDSFMRVAVKRLKSNYSTEEMENLIVEYNVIKTLDHPHVTKLLGAFTTPDEPLCIIMEFAKHGCLRSYLRSFRGVSDSGSTQTPSSLRPPTPKDVVGFAYQIALGMEYLERGVAERQFVHRDLAARNVLLFDDMQVKVSDFGLTREIVYSDIYVRRSNGKLPVKWLSPESLRDQVYTSKSDVWSYGVLLWELVTLGRQPYPGVEGERQLAVLETGYRMQRPQNCSQELYSVMTHCWNQDPARRPSFKQLVSVLAGMVSDNADYLQVNTQTIRFGNPTYLQPITLLGEEDAEKVNKASTPLLDQTDIERPNVETHRGAHVSEENDDDTCGDVNYVESYTIST